MFSRMRKTAKAPINGNPHRDCCAEGAGDKSASPPPQAPHGQQHQHGDGGPIVTAAQATLHCLTGCVIGEVAGLAIGVTLGLGVWPTIILATILSYLTGFTLGALPVMRGLKKSFWQALQLIWVGEAVSIGVMEIAMNAADYAMGGMSAPSIFAPTFWAGVAVAVPAGFLAAWPVNWLLLRNDLKKCC